MSAINFVKLRDRLHVFSDAAAYGKDGRIVLFRSKIRLAKSCPAVVCTMGNVAAGEVVEDSLVDAASFDEMIDAAPARFRECAGDDNVAVAIGGWSEARDAMEVWYARAGAHAQPFAKRRSALSYQPDLTDEQLVKLKRFGKATLIAGQFVDIAHFARTLLTLQRCEHTWGTAQGYPHDVHLVGGFGELATIGRDQSEKHTIIEWPDEIGELIRPQPIRWGHAEQANPAPTVQAPRLSRHERRAAEAKARKAA